jgi:hypothetical protein
LQLVPGTLHSVPILLFSVQTIPAYLFPSPTLGTIRPEGFAISRLLSAFVFKSSYLEQAEKSNKHVAKTSKFLTVSFLKLIMV